MMKSTKRRIVLLMVGVLAALAVAGASFGIAASKPKPVGGPVISQSQADRDARLLLIRGSDGKTRVTIIEGDGDRASIVVFRGDIGLRLALMQLEDDPIEVP